MKRSNLTILLSVWLITACDSSTSPSHLLELERIWQLQAFELDDGSVQAVPEGQVYTLSFQTDGSLHGEVDCNLCSGTYEVEGNSLRMGLLTCTVVACSPGSLDQQFHSALDTTTSFVRAGSELSIRYARGIMSFRLL